MITVHRDIRTLFLLALLALLGAADAAPLAAQSTPLRAGTRIRVQVAGSSVPLVGRVEAITGDTLIMYAERGAGTQRIANADIRTLERFQGESSQTIPGAVIGLLGGAAVGGLVGRTQPPSRGGFEFVAPSGIVYGVAIGGLVGVAVGAALGSRIHAEEWRPLGMDASLRVAPAHGGLALGGSIALRRHDR